MASLMAFYGGECPLKTEGFEKKQKKKAPLLIHYPKTPSLITKALITLTGKTRV